MAHALTETPGSSEWFECGWVTYSNESKTRLLGVPSDLIWRCGAVSEAVAAAMARGALEHSAADLAVAVTGIAGPGGGTADKPVGLVWFAWAERGRDCRTARQVFSGDRGEVRRAAVRWGLQQLLDHELASD
jgi:nicotinamide-nucleotide amidase